MNPMIAALQNSRQDAPSSSGPAAGAPVPSEAPNPVADKIAALDVKLDQILALLSNKEDDAEAVPIGPENPDNGNPADA